ncbi:hypothetical protein HSBAA_07220 [Vreelandella sulfidaeris]|uniref:Peptidase M24 domain-containing protein n=1 Tax=Vreelandella sulfidaeris TaxID=115553 RepID=A0A455U0K3_9GAMM|nr:hypothetical protein HSBAA_07220 [Halomonas sulfidaeris]
MNVPIKTPSEVEHMREAGRQAASVIEMITPHIQAGISTGKSTVSVMSILLTSWAQPLHR